MEKLLSFLGEDWDDNVLSHHEISTPGRDPSKFPQNPEAVKPRYTSAIGRWQSDLTPAEVQLVEARTAQLWAEIEQQRK